MSKWLTGARKCTQYRFIWYNTQYRYRHRYREYRYSWEIPTAPVFSHSTVSHHGAPLPPL